MPVDYNILKNVNSLSDYQRAQEEFDLRKQQLKQQMTGQDPAALRLTNEYESAIKSQDFDRARRLAAFAKIYDKNVMMDDNGNFVELPGLPEAFGRLKYGENMGGETATQQVKSAYEPGRAEDIATRQANVGLQYDPLEAAKTEAMKEQAKSSQTSVSGFDKAGVGYQIMKKATASLKNEEGAALDPSVSAVVGFRNPFKGALPMGINVGGTSAAGGQAKIDQLRGKAFLEAFESLKGGGSITEKEGEAATAAKIRLGQAQSEKDFLKALNDFEYEVDQLYALAIRKQQNAQQYLNQVQVPIKKNPYEANPNPALTQPYDQIKPALRYEDDVDALIERYSQ